ncbi:putative T7SS-secreted protein [Actinacidiphila alni]|uniref:putative T7SS-secreted protein n=1 Tax=Actinacidiphila alni TaxID=380248 RepID=UPI0033CAB3C1
MSRPPDPEWDVLDESRDPIPGDPYEVRAEATRLSRMAGTIHDQITLLRDIAGDENVGRFAEKLRETATGLRGDLGKVADRYEAVAGYLGHWADDLDACQSESLKALAKAKAAAPAAHAPVPHPPGHVDPGPGSASGPDAPTPEQRKAAHARDAAQVELAAAKRQLADIKQHRDDRASHWKQRIEDAEHDGLKDSRWDGFKDFVHQHAGLIKVLADICTWIVTGLVIASLLIPGLDIATGVLAAFMLGALAGHTALALSGDGSWMDVGLDIVAIATLRISTVVKGVMDTSVELSEGVASMLRAGSELEESATSAIKAATEGIDVLSRGNAGAFGRVWSSVSDWGVAVGKKFLAGGEKAVVENTEKLTRLAEQFPNSRLIPNALSRATGLTNAVRWSNGVANVADEFGHWSGGSDLINWMGNGFKGGPLHPEVEGDTAPRWDTFARLKELTTAEVGR